MPIAETIRPTRFKLLASRGFLLDGGATYFIVNAMKSFARIAILSHAALMGVIGCGPKQLPTNSTTPANRAQLEARYEELEDGMREADIAAFMGKNGAQVAGFSTQVLKHKPQGGSWESTPGQTDKYWASDDSTSAIHVVFGADGKAKLIQLVQLTPMGPPPDLP